jgi:hypothetical protein
VLTYWRTRLRKSAHPERTFDAVRSVIDATGVLKGKTRRALDSTLLDDVVATQDAVTQLIAAIRRVRRVVPGATDVVLSAHDDETSGKPLIAWYDPVAKAALVDALVRYALHLLAAFADVVVEAEASSALGLLALVAGQDVEQDDDGTWKIARNVAPDRVISTVDPEARHMHKSRSEYRDGYKAHIGIEPETGLVTAALTPANAPDGSTGVALLAGEEPGLQVLGDGAARHSPPWTRPSINGPSSPGRQCPPCPVASSEKTSWWTNQRGPPPALPATPSRSRRAAMPCSVFAVEIVHSGNGAPLPSAAGSSTSIPTTVN